MNTLTYKEIKDWYLNDEESKENAKKYFGDKQPSIHEIGFYSAPSWNWGYRIGIVKTKGKYFEVVTQFGAVVSARLINIPKMD